MIYKTLKFIAEQLNAYITEVKKAGDGIESPYVMLQNISRLDEEALKTTNKVLLTLVNISEEPTMKNNPANTILRNEITEYNNPPVNLNLYLLYSVCMANYEHAVIYLSHTINFFQGKNNFTRQNSITAIDGLPDDFQIILELYSLSFEQENYLWSTLGGKQHPFALYKARMIRMERKSTVETRGVIKQIRIDERNKT
jgi:hypothetical protein